MKDRIDGVKAAAEQMRQLAYKCCKSADKVGGNYYKHCLAWSSLSNEELLHIEKDQILAEVEDVVPSLLKPEHVQVRRSRRRRIRKRIFYC